MAVSAAAPPSEISAKNDGIENKSFDAEAAREDALRAAALETNKKMVHKYQSQFPKIPTMTSEELVERWRQIDQQEDERDDSANSDDETDVVYEPKVGPLLLIDVRSKEEQAVSMIPGALTMDDLETTKWINHYVHNIHGTVKRNPRAVPTIVCYCTIGYRSGREAQRLVDDLSSTFGIEIGTTVEIKNLDGILAYSFVRDAPPLLSCSRGNTSKAAFAGSSSDSFMTRRVHSYGKEWSAAVDPSFEVVYFDSKPKYVRHLLQTGLATALRTVQHTISATKQKVKESKVVSKIESSESSGSPKANRISATGFTTNDAVRPLPSEH